MKNVSRFILFLFCACFSNNFLEVASEGQIKKYLLEDSSHVCSPNVKRKIKLGKDSKSAILITQSSLSYHVVDWEKNSYCKFEVQSDNKMGLYAVIQKLNLRKNESTGECIDYVQFRSKKRVLSRKFCGVIIATTAMDELFSDTGEDEPVSNSFVDPLGEIDVFVYISKEPLRFSERTEIEIVFTAYLDCFFWEKSNYKACTLGEGCIYSEFFGDGYFNCPFVDCPDEEGCMKGTYNADIKKESIGNKVLIGSVTSLILMFTIFICCVYACKRYGAFCWAENFARSNVRENANPPQSSSSVIDEPIRIDSLNLQSAPSAPAADDKDLPPSYDSLFPSR